MNAASLLLVAAGGALGSVLRVLIGHFVAAGRLPWATIAVNVAGSLAIGWLMARMQPLDTGSLRAHGFWVLGVCGGFTTFSSFSWQTFEQLQKGHWFAAVANVSISVLVCLVATALGWRWGR